MAAIRVRATTPHQHRRAWSEGVTLCRGGFPPEGGGYPPLLEPPPRPPPRIRRMLSYQKLLGAIPLQKLFGIPRSLLELTSKTFGNWDEVAGALSNEQTKFALPLGHPRQGGGGEGRPLLDVVPS